MKGMNLAGFKKVHEDEHHAVMQHERGHQIKIIKKSLDDKLKKQLSKIPNHMADGGEVASYLPEEQRPDDLSDIVSMAQTEPSRDPASAAGDLGKSIGDTIRRGVKSGYESIENLFSDPNRTSPINQTWDAAKGFSEGLLGSQAQAAPTQVEEKTPPQNFNMTQQGPAPASQPIIQQPVQKIPNYAGAVASGYNQIEKGINEEALAAAQQGKLLDAAHQNYMKQMANIQKDYEKRSQVYSNEIDNVVHDLKEARINPDHYMESKSTAGKVSTAIGLILGGMGGGLTHQENPALKFLNAQIDRDIESQKSNISNKNNLLSAYYHQTGNLNEAIQMTRATQNAIYSSMVEQAKAKSMDPAARARADQLLGQLKVTKNQALQQAAQAGTISQLTNSGPMTQEKINAIAQVDPKKAEDIRSRFVPGMGMGMANTDKDAEVLKKMKSSIDSGIDGINRLLTISKIPGKSFSPNLRAEAEVIQQGLVGLLREDILGPGTMNPDERKIITGMIANPTNIFSLDSNTQVKLNALTRKLQKTLQNEAANRGIQGYKPAVQDSSVVSEKGYRK